MGDHKPASSKLRLMTYLAPGVSVALFELLRNYLEEKTGMEAYLIYESRWSGPPMDRVDPLTNDEADIVFMCSTAFLQQRQKKNKYIELCPAAPLHIHPRASDQPVYFSEVTVLKSNRYRFKDFPSLKGCRWAYTDDISLSGNLIVLAELKKRGYNANFFGSIVQSGSHLNSIKMLLNGQADAAAIDSNTLMGHRLEHPEQAEQLDTIVSLGPLPVYPIVFNARLPSELKAKITKALLDITAEGNPKWAGEFLTLGVRGYTKTSVEENYRMEEDIQTWVKNMTMAPAYY